MKKIKKMPATIYVTRDSENDVFLVSESLRELLLTSENHGEPVGVYELASTKKVAIKKTLDDA